MSGQCVYQLKVNRYKGGFVTYICWVTSRQPDVLESVYETRLLGMWTRKSKLFMDEYLINTQVLEENNPNESWRAKKTITRMECASRIDICTEVLIEIAVDSKPLSE